MLSVTGLSCARGERTLVGLSPPESGEIHWRGELAPPTEFHRDLIYLGHHAAVKEKLMPLENLRLSASLDGLALTESPPSTTPCANA
jgi:heme exporter protein A